MAGMQLTKNMLLEFGMLLEKHKAVPFKDGKYRIIVHPDYYEAARRLFPENFEILPAWREKDAGS